MRHDIVFKNTRPLSAALCEEDLSNINIANQYAINGRQSDGEYVNVYDSTSTVREDVSKISEANPEPESSLEKCIEDRSIYSRSFHDNGKQEQCNAMMNRFKRQRDIYASFSIGLGVALLGSLIGLIIVKVLSTKTVVVGPFSENEIGQMKAAEISDPLWVHQFPSVSKKDSAIAQAFADHSLYQSFYGIKYTGPGSSFDLYSEGNNAKIAKREYDRIQGDSGNSSYKTQHQISLDMALLSRITPRIRLVHDSSMLAERVIQAIVDLNLNLRVHLSIGAAAWREEEYKIRELINSAPANFISAVYIESDADEKIVYSAYDELNTFLQRCDLASVIQISVVIPENSQANPLELTKDPGVAIEWINNDQSRNLYTNLQTPSETSERARFMTSWVCQVVPSLRTNVEWFWASAFDDSNSVTNGIFTEDRDLKPAGLPRCNK